MKTCWRTSNSGLSNVSHNFFCHRSWIHELIFFSWYEQCLTSLKQQIDNHQTQVLLNMKKLLKRTHDNLIYSLVNLGLWGAIQVRHFILKLFIDLIYSFLVLVSDVFISEAPYIECWSLVLPGFFNVSRSSKWYILGCSNNHNCQVTSTLH